MTQYDVRIRPGIMRVESPDARRYRFRDVRLPCALSPTDQDLYCLPCLDEIFGGGYSFWYGSLVVNYKGSFGFYRYQEHAAAHIYSIYYSQSTIVDKDRKIQQVKEICSENCKKPNGELRTSTIFVSKEWVIEHTDWEQVTPEIRFLPRLPSLVEQGVGL